MLDTSSSRKPSALTHTRAHTYPSMLTHTLRTSRSLNAHHLQTTLDTPTSSQAPLLDRYQIMDICTTGGFGDVLICWDTRLQRRVAIKRIAFNAHSNPTNSDLNLSSIQDDTIKDALAEARVASMLAHPNIVTMYDFETDDAYAYLVMEYIDGMTLAELLDRVEGGVLTPDETSYVARAISKAIAYAHENRVLHLDIKPSNIMFDHMGSVKLCDFGMATLASAAGYADARGGTVGYMPQEQIDGDLVDERCDVFAFASVIWQALCGKAPFGAPDVETSRKLMQKPPKPPLSSYRLDMPAVSQSMLQDILLQALESTPHTRTSDIRAFGEEISHVLGDPHIGKSSIHDLITQALADDNPTEDEIREQLPLSFRYPWLPRVATRAATLITILIPALFLSTHLGYEPVVQGGVSLAIVVTSIVLPAYASVIPAALLVWGLISNPSAFTGAHVLLPLLFLVLYIGTYTVFGRTYRHATIQQPSHPHAHISICMWIGALIGSPFISCVCTPVFLSPLTSALTVATSWLITHITQACLYAPHPSSHSFDIGFCVEYLLSHTTKEELVALSVCVVSTGVASFIYHKTTSRIAHKLAQTIVSVAFVASFVLQGTNSIHVASGIWSTFGLVCTIIAVSLSILMYIIADNTHTQSTAEEDESGS